MEREFSSETVLMSGLFVDHATTEVEAEEEARETMVVALSDDISYWERLSSAVLADESQNEKIDSVVKPEFKDFAVTWARYGRSLDIIHDYSHYAALMKSRFERREANKARKAAAIGRVSRFAHYTGGGGGGGGRGCGGSYAYDSAIDNESIDFDPLFDINMAMSILSGVEEIFLAPIDGLASVLPSLQKDELDIVVSVFDHMMHCFKECRFKKKYGFNSQDRHSAQLHFLGDVPSYFANVVDQSIYRRKVLSMAGLRNLLQYGPVIYDQLKSRQFSGDPAAYNGDVGLSLMRRVTGNVVDLDTTVLRCSCKATLNAINMSNAFKKEPTFSSVEAFSSSQQATEIAIHCSKPLLDDFAKLMNMTEEQRRRRQISESQIVKPIPLAQSNTDRGRMPIWHYVNVGQDSFHCNVPNIDDVNGALLKAPYHCAMLWAMTFALFGNDRPELERRIEDFFENCIVDACFNMKWKSIEEFGEKMKHEGTIVDVIQRAQAGAQHIFTMAFFDADDEKHSREIEETWRLVEGRIAKEASKGMKTRAITREDVEAWVADPSISI